MDELSRLFGLLTGNWYNQSPMGKTLLSCVVLLIMACACGVPLVIVYIYTSF